MLALVLAFTLQGDPAAGVLDRHAAFMKKTPRYSVQVSTSALGMEGTGKGSIEMDYGKAYRFVMKWAPYHYGIVLNRKGELEIEHSDKMYDFQRYTGFGAPESRISPIPAVAFPHVLFAQDLRRLLGPSPKFVGMETVENDRTEVLEVQVRSAVVEGGPENQLAIYKTYVDGIGRLRRFLFEIYIDERLVRRIDTTFSHYQSEAKGKPFKFEIGIPNGYVPFAVADENHGLEIGKKLPMMLWTDVRTGQKVSLKTLTKEKPALIVLTGDDPAMEPDPTQVVKQIQKVAVIHLNRGKTKEKARPLEGCPSLYDSTGNAVSAIGPPGTPMFYLVDGWGRVRHMWYGFNAAEPQTLVEEILNAYSEL